MSQEDQPLGFRLLDEAVDSGAYVPPSPEYIRYSKLRGAVLCVDGVLSAGKTTLGKAIAEYLNAVGVKAEFFQECVNNKLLATFYANPQQEAFGFQCFMLKACISNLEIATCKARELGIVAVVDRSIWGNAVFAALQTDKGNISRAGWEVYLDILKSRPHTSDCVVYLDVDPSKCLERMKLRGREAEATVPLSYLEELEQYYTTAMLLHLRHRASNIVPINWNNFGSVQSVLDAALLGRKYKVSGQAQLAFSGGRVLRAKLMAELIAKGEVKVGC